MAENWKKSIAEASCVRKAVLDNGLTVLVREMPGFDGVHRLRPDELCVHRDLARAGKP